MTGKSATMIIIDDPYRPTEPDPKKLDELYRETFDNDIIKSMEDGRFDKAFPEITNHGSPTKPKHEYKKNCGDCGQFVKKDRWVRVGDPNKEHPLCLDCYSLYDDPAYM